MSESDTRSRFGRRQWRRRLTVARPYLIGVLLVALLGFAGWIVFASTWLAVDDVDVEGTRLLTSEEVVAAADIDLGTPLVRVDLDEITHRIEEIPEVSAASTHRSWPHTVTITVTERTPLATVRQRGEWWLMDREGVLFRKTGERDPAMPVVQTPADFGEEALREVAAVVEALPAELLAETRRVHAATRDSITIRLEGRREVVWGSAAESDQKVEVLMALLNRKARVYDVSVPGQPTTAQ